LESINQKLFNLDKKVIVVTGAAGLLGTKHCEAIAAFGGSIIAIDKDKKKLEKLEKNILKTYKIDIKIYCADITNEKEIKSLSLKALNHFRRIDCLVNNAANNPKVEKNNIKEKSRLENFSLDDWNNDIAVSLTGAFLNTKYFGKIISENSNGGVIINIGSDLSLIAPDQRLYSKKNIAQNLQPVKPVSYSVVKSGLVGFTRYVATYWPDKVRCNIMCPGGIQNDQPREFIKNVSHRIPMGRMATSSEFQGTLIWLLSDASKYLNGAIIPVDGGRSAW
jgi:NAD(P)-dependent dehydrogenase (short-subunit alcohol dehydrogenase family)|tara:strand:+ start:8076 stop:8909 length:834 start_codon:yes stop_codon:yes gene_type:complete